LASSIAASHGCEKNGPTALLQSVLMLDPEHSWSCGYNVNLRLHPSLLRQPEHRIKAGQMLNGFFSQGGQEMQINCVDSNLLREAQKHPEAYGHLVVRVAGFSECFVRLHPSIQEEIIVRAEHLLT
jgi:formate C-acetyltransferase/4-hydroxyphenylacetate decarboxylase large subunit